MSHDHWDSETYRRVIERASEAATRWTAALPDRDVCESATLEELRDAFGGSLPEKGTNAVDVVSHLADRGEPGLIASPGPRFFGYVIGGSTPAGLGADILVSAWDQNAGLYSATPTASVIEETAARWALEALGLPNDCGVGFVTGCQMANTTALAAARNSVLAKHDWDVETKGLQGAPTVNVITGAQAHATIYTALRLIGLGSATIIADADDQGRMSGESLREKLRALTGPTIVCAQAGNVNSGAFDPLEEICQIARESGAWVHVDGAFGLWALASRRRESLSAGARDADSWATDAHKWLNVPYDSGIVIVRDRAAHLGATSVRASYLIQGGGNRDDPRDPLDWTPEFSRRARGIPVWAVMSELGREGLEAMIDRGCDLALDFADSISRVPGVTVLNEVVLNQVLFAVEPPSGTDHDQFHQGLVRKIQEDGDIWLSGTNWQGKAALRFSISNWATSSEDIGTAVSAIDRAIG